ncbi:MAG TPA: Xaa-Pro peptidase family protein [Anaeromyxobacteraceae bacterium]|nr:Xaa-Pro peptidase family protein [Anaeromyxobacteraceae bacterium]
MADELGAEIRGRVARFQEALRARGLDAAALTYWVDVFYFSGTRQIGMLWIPTRGAPALFIRKSLARARSEAALEDIRPFPSSKDLGAALGEAKAIGLAFDVTPVAQLEWYRRQLPGRDFADVAAPIRDLRSAKSPHELGLMREGAKRMVAAMAEVPSFLRAGMREVDVAAELELRLRRLGNEGSPRLRTANMELFTGLVVSGDAAADPGFFDGPVTGRGLSAARAVGPSTRVVGRDEPVIIDYTATFNGYTIDMTRVFVCGTLRPELARGMEAALAIQAAVARRLVPGEVPQDIWEEARAMADSAGLGQHFMGPPGDQARFVGHGVGLELDELPVLAPGFKSPLVAGQVVAVEPKFVFPGLGAVGVENTWVVAEGGGERLTVLADGALQV